MKLLSSNLSKPRRRIYGLLLTGLLAAVLTSAVGALIVWLGHSQPDVVQPFWECGEYVLLLSIFNLGIYAAILWNVRRLSRRDTDRGTPLERSQTVLSAPESDREPTPDASGLESKPAAEPPPGTRRQVSRQVRGSVSSLNLDK